MDLETLTPLTPVSVLGVPGSSHVDYVYGEYWRVDDVYEANGHSFDDASEPYQVTPINVITRDYKAV